VGKRRVNKVDDGRELSDLDLVRRIKAGDEGALALMIERYHARVYSLSYGVLRNAEDAEEATQDTFLTLYRKIGTFDESKKFFSWFYRVALNQAYSRARRRKSTAKISIQEHQPRFSDDGRLATVDWPDASVAIEDEASARELAARAAEFIEELPRAYRDVIWMADVEEMPAAEIAEVLGISIPALKSRLHRARLHVRGRLAEISRPALAGAGAEAAG
jgi:RNA polymerase sigma-70 factor, ECF subfamily